MKFADRILQIKPSPTLAVAARAAAMKAQGIDVIGFGTGEPDFDTPEHIKSAGIKSIESGKTKYTAVGGIAELKKAIVDKFKRDNGLTYNTNEVIVNCGGKHSFYNLMQVLLNPGDEVIVPAPYWVSYPSMVELADGVAVIIETGDETNFKITPQQLKKAISKKTRAIVINSPSNPTGSIYTKDELSALAAAVEDPDILFITDDIYESIIYDGHKFFNIAMLSDDLKKRTVVLNGVSKAYSMTGWRIGYMAGNKDLIDKIDIIQSQSTSNPTSISQYASVEALNGPQDVIATMVEAFRERRDIIVKGLNDVPGFKCLCPDGAFYAFPRISGVKSLKGWKTIEEKCAGETLSNQVTLYLMEEAKVAVVPGIAFGSDEYIRLSFATSNKNIIEGVKRIKDAMEKLS